MLRGPSRTAAMEWGQLEPRRPAVYAAEGGPREVTFGGAQKIVSVAQITGRCLCLPSCSGITEVWCHTWLYVSASVLNSDLVQQAFSPLSCLSSPLDNVTFSSMSCEKRDSQRQRLTHWQELGHSQLRLPPAPGLWAVTLVSPHSPPAITVWLYRAGGSFFPPCTGQPQNALRRETGVPTFISSARVTRREDAGPLGFSTALAMGKDSELMV